MPGLAPEESYDFALRLSDELGAVAVAPQAGSAWLDHGIYPFGFDQGPCALKACACGPHLGEQCQVDYDCCAGRCFPAPTSANPYLRTCQ
jgi:hypothetical protein